MRSSTAVPCPTSTATSSNCPSAGRGGCGHSNGHASGSASKRSLNGNGATSNAAASSPAACAQSGATGTTQTAAGHDASHASKATSPCTSAAATVHNAGSRLPSSASGVTASVISGIATRLARNPTSDSCWKNTSVSGASPSVAITCVRSPCRALPARCRGQPRQPAAGGVDVTSRVRSAGSEAISRPTAANDSQKPGCSSAHGSTALTTTAAASSTSGHGQCSPSAPSSVTVASIHTVRWDGTPQPEQTA